MSARSHTRTRRQERERRRIAAIRRFLRLEAEARRRGLPAPIADPREDFIP